MKKPSKMEFTAYGQASLEMAKGVFQLLRSHNAILFASAIPRGITKPPIYEAEEFLRKDHVFLFKRLYYFLDERQEYWLLIMDEADKSSDRKFVLKMENYFEKTKSGTLRTRWIVPTPFFVSSDMAYPVQAADLCIYCINWGFRLPTYGMNAETRPEIVDHFGPWLNELQYRGSVEKDGHAFPSYGIVYVPDPYTAR